MAFDMIGTHGLGNASDRKLCFAQCEPPRARPFSDVAIVHDGQITDYFTWRDRLTRAGYQFLTENDRNSLLSVMTS